MPAHAVRRRPARPLPLLPRLQPGLRPRAPGLVGRSQGDRSGRHRRLHAPGLVRAAARPSSCRPSPGCSGCGPTSERGSCSPLPPASRAGAGAVHALGRRSPRSTSATTGRARCTTWSTLPDLAAAERFNARLGTDRQPRLRRPADPRPRLARPAGDRCSSRARTATWCRRTSGRRGSRRWARSPGSTRIADCYADLADHIFAVETGLSSDPAMNWRVSSLDRYRLVSNSDAHSPPELGREATVFATELDYFAVRDALRDRRRAGRDDRVLPGGGQVPPRRAPDLRGRAGRRRETRAQGGLLPGLRQAGDGRRAAPGRGRWPTGRTGDRPAAPPGSSTTSSRCRDAGRDPRRRRRSRSRSTARLDALVAALGPELYDPRARRRWTTSRRVGGDLLGEAIAAAAAPATCAGRRATTASTASSGCSTRASSARPRSDALFDLPATSRPRARPPARECAAGAKPARQPVPAEDRPRTPKQRTARRSPEPPLAAPASPHEPFEPMLAGMEEVGTGAARPARRDAAGGRVRARRADADRRRPGHRQDPHAHPPHRLPVRASWASARAVPGDHLHPAGGRASWASGCARCSARPPMTSPSRRSTRSGCAILREQAARAGLATAFRVVDEAERPHSTARRCAGAADEVRGAGAPAARGGADDGLRARYRAALRAATWWTWTSCVARAGRAAARATRRWPSAYRRRWRGRHRRRVPGRRPGPVRTAAAAVPGRRRPVRDRRPGPGDLSVPRRRRRLLPPLRRRLRRRPGGAADPQLPLHRDRSSTPPSAWSRRPRWCPAGPSPRSPPARARSTSPCTPRPTRRPRPRSWSARSSGCWAAPT